MDFEHLCITLPDQQSGNDTHPSGQVLLGVVLQNCWGAKFSALFVCSKFVNPLFVHRDKLHLNSQFYFAI